MKALLHNWLLWRWVDDGGERPPWLADHGARSRPRLDVHHKLARQTPSMWADPAPRLLGSTLDRLRAEAARGAPAPRSSVRHQYPWPAATRWGSVLTLLAVLATSWMVAAPETARPPQTPQPPALSRTDGPAQGGDLSTRVRMLATGPSPLLTEAHLIMEDARRVVRELQSRMPRRPRLARTEVD